MTNDPTFAPGSIFHGRYEIVRALKTGGMGAVYEVIDGPTKRRRALKVMLETSVVDADLRARFTREATVTAEIESDHIVETFDAGVTPEGTPFIVMELLRGEDLEVVLDRGSRFVPEAAIALLHQAASALDRTHAAGIVHRDLKPANLFLVTREGAGARLKVLDFGIAKVLSPGASKTTRAMGTPLYMAPEQVTGDAPIGPATDRYALAHIAYALLVGDAYWSPEAEAAETPFKLLSKTVSGPTASPSARARALGVTLPAGFDAWFLRGANPDASARFAASSAMIAALAELFSLRSVDAHTPVPMQGALVPSAVRRATAAPEGARPTDVETRPSPHVASQPTVRSLEAGAPASSASVETTPRSADAPTEASPRAEGATKHDPPTFASPGALAGDSLVAASSGRRAAAVDAGGRSRLALAAIAGVLLVGALIAGLAVGTRTPAKTSGAAPREVGSSVVASPIPTAEATAPSAKPEVVAAPSASAPTPASSAGSSATGRASATTRPPPASPPAASSPTSSKKPGAMGITNEF